MMRKIISTLTRNLTAAYAAPPGTVIQPVPGPVELLPWGGPGCACSAYQFDTRGAVLAEVAAFCRETGKSESWLGRKACSASDLVERLQQGRGCTIDNLDRLRRTMAAELAAHRLAQAEDAARKVGA